MDNKGKTMLCVFLAGTLFIGAIILNIWYLALVAAFFDWLPLPTNWMKFGEKVNKKALILHISLTLFAYGLLIAWIILRVQILSFLFLELWWSAVVAGFLIVS